MHGWLIVSLLSAESSRLGLHFVGNFHRWSRVIAFGSWNVYTEVICFGWWRRGREHGMRDREREGEREPFVRLAIRSFSHSFLDEFYWNFMNDRKKSVFQIRHDRKKIGNRNRNRHENDNSNMICFSSKSIISLCTNNSINRLR